MDSDRRENSKHCGSLLKALKEAQHEQGYLAEEELRRIAGKFGIPYIKVLETASFYSMLYLEPVGKNVISVCDSAACHLAGGKSLLETVEAHLGIQPGETTADGMFTLHCCGCLGACDKAPAMMINGRTYGPVTAADVEEILQGKGWGGADR